MTAKLTVAELGLDLAAQTWRRSGQGDGAIEVAFVRASPSSVTAAMASAGSEWVLMRVTGDPEQRVLVFDRHEWGCFLHGAQNGEFDDAAAARPAMPATPRPAPPVMPGLPCLDL